jgi:glyoxylase-like metal-dependent hydrolase (beta-lactamase superfamily II)
MTQRRAIYDRGVEFVELRPGLYRWELRHPEWTPADAEGGGWGEVVASYALEAENGLVLIDPLAPPDDSDDAERFWRWVSERSGPGRGSPSVLITIFWHARSSQAVLDRFPEASVWSYEPARELVSERTAVTDGFRAGDELPGGAVPYHVGRALEVVLWLPSHHALVAGDVLLGDGDGGARLCPRSWLGGGRTYADIRAALAPVIALPVEVLLLTHGEPVLRDGRAALERALRE